MRDLEIRGAGNLLGEAQSGHIAAVGYDLYCQMVTEAVGEMKGEPVKEPSEVKLDVPTDAFLPQDYVEKEELRLEAYRRLAGGHHGRPRSTTSAPSGRTATARCPMPREALLDVGALRAECHRLGLRDLQVQSHQARLSPIELKTSEEMRLRRLNREAFVKEDLKQLVVPIKRGTEPGPVPRRLPARARPRVRLTRAVAGPERSPLSNVAAVIRRTVLAVGIALGAASTLSSCSAADHPNAVATVDDAKLTQDDLEQLLNNQVVQEALSIGQPTNGMADVETQADP